MDDIIVRNDNLPESVDDLSRFVLIGRDRLAAVRAAIRVIDKVGVASEVYQQKLAEGQEIAEAVLDAEVRLGELRKAVEHRQVGNKGNQYTVATSRHVEMAKTPLQQFDATAQLTKDSASQIEKLASHPDIVERVKAEARENNELVTRKAVLDAIKTATDKPHIANNTGYHEWYTPREYIDAAREVMGTIDLDPASSEIANQVVQAGTYYSEENNGLENPWFGNVWLNPPYSAELVAAFANKLVESYDDIEQAIVLVDNATETKWFAKIVSLASAMVFPTGRVKFYMPDGSTGAPLQGQVILYIGQEPALFLQTFSKFGWGVKPWKDV